MIINVRYRITNRFQQEHYERTGMRPMSDQEKQIDSETLTKEELAMLDKAKGLQLPYPYQHPVFDTYLQRNRLTLCQINYDKFQSSGMRMTPVVFDHLPQVKEVFEALLIEIAQYNAVRTLKDELRHAELFA